MSNRQSRRLLLGLGVVVLVVTFLGPRTAQLLEGQGRSIPSWSARPVLPPPDEATRRLKVPPGFAIRIFADNLFAGQPTLGFSSTGPRFMAFGPDRSLYVSLTVGGRILRLPDRNGDGLADTIEVALDGLFLPHGLEWHEGWLYVAEGDRVERFKFDPEGKPLERELVTDNIPRPDYHVTRTLHFGPDGKLYVSVGANCNICEPEDPRYGAILRFEADGSIPKDNPFARDPDPRRRAVWAFGLRNSVDFFWMADGRLWATHNGVDHLGDEVPPEEVLVEVQPGRSHGWPYCFTPGLGPNLGSNRRGEVPDPTLSAPAGFSCAEAVPALFTDLAHSAPLGATLGSSAHFPTEYKESVYIAYHGSWATSLENTRECKVERISLARGVPVGHETFISGWRASGKRCGDAETWGRPADVKVGPDGALYISDDHGGRIYRVVYTGP
ncbi:MAG: sorbosone dehydrogenase [Chloroflexota bacterium]